MYIYIYIHVRVSFNSTSCWGGCELLHQRWFLRVTINWCRKSQPSTTSIHLKEGRRWLLALPVVGGEAQLHGLLSYLH